MQPAYVRDNRTDDVRARRDLELGNGLVLHETHDRFEKEPSRLGAGKYLQHRILLAPVLDIAFYLLVIEVWETRPNR